MKELQREKKLFILAMAVLLILQLSVILIYGSKKSGFHEDELYTYYSTNKTAGLFIEDRTWMEGEKLRQELVVLEGEQFRYSLVKIVQSWDVHPPFYYYLIHTVCSLSAGVFSKWQGIMVNMIAYVLSFLLLAAVVFTALTKPDAEPDIKTEAKPQGKADAGFMSKLGCMPDSKIGGRLSVLKKESGQGSCEKENPTGKGQKERRAYLITFLACLFWGFGSAVISGVLFIRMYQWLTMFVLLCLWLHLRAIKHSDFGIRRFLLPLAVTVFLGFMTQYYYIIFHVFLGAGFCALLLKHKRLKELFSYAAACAAGLLGAILYYPSCLSHIFRGYRGTEAVSEFGKISNTWERLRFFTGLFNDYEMNGTLYIWLLLLCLLAITFRYLKGKGKVHERFFTEPVALMSFAAAGYFFTVSKTALLLGKTSNRYQLPVYGILCFLLIYGLWFLAENVFLESKGKIGQKQIRIMAGILMIALLAVDGSAMSGGRVFFLYEEEQEMDAYIEAHKEVPVIVSYNEAGEDHVWWLADKLMESEKFYFVSQQNTQKVEDEQIKESDSVLVYISEWEGEEAFLEELIEQNPGFSSYRKIGKKEIWTLYEVS